LSGRNEPECENDELRIRLVKGILQDNPFVRQEITSWLVGENIKEALGLKEEKTKR
jgi:hypothetical protein